jgi:hypothetical protein
MRGQWFLIMDCRYVVTGDAPIVKRDTTQVHHAWISESEEHQHLGKAVLLHALGNGALERSKVRLLRHAAPNSGHHIWRRAALDALRHYNCTEVNCFVALE